MGRILSLIPQTSASGVAKNLHTSNITLSLQNTLSGAAQCCSTQLAQHNPSILKPDDCDCSAQRHTGTLYSIFSPLEHKSDQEHAEGAGQSSVELGGFSVDATFGVLQVRPGEVSWQPQALPEEPLTDRLQHAAGKHGQEL